MLFPRASKRIRPARRLVAWTLLVGLALLAAPLRAQGSDDCVSATPIAGVGAFSISNVGATDSGATPACGLGPSADVFLRWTAGAQTDYRFSICTTDFDAVLAVLEGCGGALIGCEDADGCTASLFDIELEVRGLTPGAEYVLQVDGWQAMEGTGVLEITPILAPQNDDCSGAVPLVGTGVFPFDTRAATTDGPAHPSCFTDGPATIENDVWFTWTAPMTGTVSISTCGLTALDTRLAVYGPDTDCPPAFPPSCNDDACHFQSEVLFRAFAGVEYRVRLGSAFAERRGRGSLAVNYVTSPPNDARERALPVSGLGSFPFDNRSATTDGPASASCSSPGMQIERDVWFAWTSPFDGIFRASTCGRTTLDTVMQVLDGTAEDAAVLGCSDDACGTQSAVLFRSTAGATHLVRIGSAGDVYAGAGSFTIDVPPLPAGDSCMDAIPLMGPGVFDFDTRGATNTDGAASPEACVEYSTGAIDGDLWYRWTSDCTGTMRWSTAGLTEVDTKLAVYAGAACTDGAPLGCSDDSAGEGLQSTVTWFALEGETYRLRLGTFPGAPQGSGQFSLSALDCAAGPGVPFCTGQGCPCGNDAHGAGCVNSSGAGARLLAVGTTRVGANDLALVGTQFPPGNSALVFMGAAETPPVAVGDGLACTGGLYRFAPGIVGEDGSLRFTGVVGAAPAGLIRPGDSRSFQAWTRDVLCGPPPSPCPSPCSQGSNLSSGLTLGFTP